MFRLRRPKLAEVRAILADLAGAPFTYPEVGATAGELPSGYDIDRYDADLGRGARVFERGRAAIADFVMYPPAWTLIVSDGPLAEGLVFASVIRHLGFWSINPGRVIYTIDDPDCFGFAFGTLPGHSERGEERFAVVRDPETDRVEFDALAFSRPEAPLARLGEPIARALQRRFARDAAAAMRAATGG